MSSAYFTPLHTPRTDEEKILFGIGEEIGCINVSSINRAAPAYRMGGPCQKISRVVWSFQNGGIWINFWAVIDDEKLLLSDPNVNDSFIKFELSDPGMIEKVRYFLLPLIERQAVELNIQHETANNI